MATNTMKILVAGSVKGQYSKLFKRVSDVNNKAGPFDLLLCVGDFFGDDFEAYNELINGSTELPNIPTYILSCIPIQLLQFHPNLDSFDQGCELTDGITFLGRSGILTTSLGLRIAYLNGRYREESSEKDKNICNFNDKEYESLVMSCKSSSNGVDILLTTEWPKNIFNHVNGDDIINESIKQKSNEHSSVKISQLCNMIQPRYHFVSGGMIGVGELFYERPPYRHHLILNETTKNVTRFISMADVANNKKMKWIYGFNIVPGRYCSFKELTAQPGGVTENPFRSMIQEQREQDDLLQSQSNQFRYDLSHSQQQDDYHQNNRRKFDKRSRDDDQQQRRPKKELKVDLENCWFCLASPNVDKSLIVSIGEHSYLALAKGGLTDDHMMILPIEHIRSTVEIQNQQLKEEIEKFKNALTGYYQQRSMIPVFFERNFKSAHFQLQVLGLPETKLSSLKEAVSEVFNKFEFHEIALNDDIEDVIRAGIPYFYFECYNHYKFFVRIQTKREFFPLQIGRELMAHKLLLNCPDRVEWRQQSTQRQNESELTLTIRKSFKPFDFTI